MDNPLPSVSIDFPSNGAVLSGTETLTAHVPIGVTVSFLLTGASGTTDLGENWNQVAGGPSYRYRESHDGPQRLLLLGGRRQISGGLSNATSVAVAGITRERSDRAWLAFDALDSGRTPAAPSARRGGRGTPTP